MVRTTLILVLLGACDDGERPAGGGADAAPGLDASGEACAPEEIHGRYAVYYAGAALYFSGRHDDAPPVRFSTPRLSEGACAYFGPSAAFCDPPCTGGRYCAPEGVCLAYPTALPVGTVAIEANGRRVGATAEWNTYAAGPLEDFASPGDRVALEVEGAGAVGAFEAETTVVPPLVLPSTELTVHEHEDLVLTWPAAASPAATRTILHFDNDHHGVAAFIECDADDASGALTVPAALLDALILDGETGIGTYIENAWIARRQATVRRTSVGCASFASEAEEHVFVETVRVR